VAKQAMGFKEVRELKVGWTYAIATANTVGIRGHVQATGNQTANLQQYECYQALLLISNI